MSYVAETYEPEPQADDVATFLAWSFVAAFGLWAAWGWIAEGVNALSLLLAVVFGLFQIATNILAVKVRQLAGRGAWLTAVFATVAMLATGLLTHESLNHAYAVTQARGYANADPVLMSWLLLVVPYLEPLLFWINRLLMEPNKPVQRAVGVGVLTALSIWLFGTGSAMAVEPPQNSIHVPREPKAITHRVSRSQMRQEEPARAQAKLLARQGMKAARIVEATGVPLSTCKRYVKDARETQTVSRATL